VPTNGQALTAGIPTLGSQFKASGYRTAAIGKWHLGADDATCPNGHGFEYFYGFHNGCIDFYSHRYYWGEPKRVNFHDLWRNRTETFEDGRYFTERIAEETVVSLGEGVAVLRLRPSMRRTTRCRRRSIKGSPPCRWRRTWRHGDGGTTNGAIRKALARRQAKKHADILCWRQRRTQSGAGLTELPPRARTGFLRIQVSPSTVRMVKLPQLAGEVRKA
jgi:hypothetical protein